MKPNGIGADHIDIAVGGITASLDYFGRFFESTAEAGAIYSMFAPTYSVVISAGVLIRIPVVIASRIDPVFNGYLDAWIKLKQGDGTVDALYEHWILAHDVSQQGPRWPVIRNVFAWVD